MTGTQKFKIGSRDLDHAYLGVVCRPKANACYGLHVYENYEDFSRARNMKEDPKRKNRVIRGDWVGQRHR